MRPSEQPDLVAPGEDEAPARFTGVAGDSIRVASFTLASRVTGVVKVAVIGAVLGPTFFGNTFQLTNTLPNLIYYGFLAGSLFVSLLVPTLVGHVNTGGLRSAERVAGGFLGLTLLALAAVAPVAVLFGPLLLRIAGPGAAAGATASQEHVGRVLVVMFIPQVFCYCVVGTATSAMNTRRRFTLAAAAPAMENLGIIAVLGATAVLFGNRTTIDSVTTPELLLLGLGTTGAVALHAAVQWWGARRAGITLLPRAGWRDPEVRALVRRAVPSIAQAGLMAVQVLSLLALANRVAGGVVAFQIALNFYFLAIALGATPVALSLLPRLATLDLRGDLAGFRDTLMRGFALGLFIAVPSAVGYAVLAEPIARAVAIGRMGSADGIALVAAGIAPLAFAVVAQTAFAIASYAAFARKDTTSPLISMALQAVCCLSFAGLALRVHGSATITVLGAAYGAAMAVAATHLILRLRRRLGPASHRVSPSLVKIGLGAALMAAPVLYVARGVGAAVRPPLGPMSAVLAAAVAGLGVFVATQLAMRTSELRALTGGLMQMVTRRRRARQGAGDV
ncbi:murein biosynthesis integral membrane protein MurJ [Amycolatopsis thermophila]|nr:lipid II flippase MurJ [Amycolatopsis thermophila]